MDDGAAGLALGESARTASAGPNGVRCSGPTSDAQSATSDGVAARASRRVRRRRNHGKRAGVALRAWDEAERRSAKRSRRAEAAGRAATIAPAAAPLTDNGRLSFDESCPSVFGGAAAGEGGDRGVVEAVESFARQRPPETSAGMRAAAGGSAVATPPFACRARVNLERLHSRAADETETCTLSQQGVLVPESSAPPRRNPRSAESVLETEIEAIVIGDESEVENDLQMLAGRLHASSQAVASPMHYHPIRVEKIVFAGE